MRSFADGLNQAYGRRRGQWLLGAALACACMALTFAVCKVTFLNNDDANILYALAGYRSGAPYPTHRFINVALGLCVSGLYRALPAVPWWTVYQLIALFAALTVVNACTLKLARRAGLPPAMALGLAALLYLTVFVYTVVWIAFTLTACMLGTAACALIIAADRDEPASPMRPGTAIGAIALLVLCYFTRNSSGYVMTCFFLAAVLYRLLSAPRGTRRRIVCFAISGLAAVTGAVLLNGWGVSRFNPPYYAEFEAARGHFIDYPHVSYAEDPAFFATLGWDETVYDLADNLCYLDPAVSADAMNAVTAYRPAQQTGLLQRLSDALAYGERFFRGSGVSQYMLVTPVLGTLWLFACSIRRRRLYPEAATGCAVAAGAFLLCFYLCYAGRFPVRTFMLVAIPTAVLETLLLLHVWGIASNWESAFHACGEKRGHFRKYFDVVGIFITSMAIAWGLAMTQTTLLRYDRTDLVRQNAAAEAYAMAHPENIYLTDVTSLNNIGAFTVYPDEKPVNLIDWGGTGMYSGWKEAQLAANGLTALSGALFCRDDVYFITETDGEKLAMLSAYLQAHWDATGCAACDTAAPGLTVYRFDFASKEGGA